MCFRIFLDLRKVIWCIYNIKQQSQWGLGHYPVIKEINISAMRYVNSHTGIKLWNKPKCDKQKLQIASCKFRSGLPQHKFRSNQVFQQMRFKRLGFHIYGVFFLFRKRIADNKYLMKTIPKTLRRSTPFHLLCHPNQRVTLTRLLFPQHPSHLIIRSY